MIGPCYESLWTSDDTDRIRRNPRSFASKNQSYSQTNWLVFITLRCSKLHCPNCNFELVLRPELSFLFFFLFSSRIVDRSRDDIAWYMYHYIPDRVLSCLYRLGNRVIYKPRQNTSYRWERDKVVSRFEITKKKKKKRKEKGTDKSTIRKWENKTQT